MLVCCPVVAPIAAVQMEETMSDYRQSREERIAKKQDEFIRYIVPIAAVVVIVVIATAAAQYLFGIDFGYKF